MGLKALACWWWCLINLIRGALPKLIKPVLMSVSELHELSLVETWATCLNAIRGAEGAGELPLLPMISVLLSWSLSVSLRQFSAP